MNYRLSYIAQAMVYAFAGAILPSLAQENNKTLNSVIVTADPFGSSENSMVLAPAKVLSGDELRDKLGGSIGQTLSNELGVSSSGFSSGAPTAYWSPVDSRGVKSSLLVHLNRGVIIGRDFRSFSRLI